jgi:hypothetical protein
MPALAHQFARLVGSFHGIFLRRTPDLGRLSIRHAILRADARIANSAHRAADFQFSVPARDWRGLYGSPPGSSMRRAGV